LLSPLNEKGGPFLVAAFAPDGAAVSFDELLGNEQPGPGESLFPGPLRERKQPERA